MHRSHELESAGVIRGLRHRLAPSAESSVDTEALRAEVDRLRSQNEKMKQAMRHCIDCEYRVEVMAKRASDGQVAAGGDEPVAPR